jgi:hypothetical protein
VLGVKKTISIKGVTSFSLFFLNARITNNIIETIIAINIMDSTIQPTTGEHRCGPARELKSNQIPIAELSPQVNQYLLAITMSSCAFIFKE